MKKILLSLMITLILISPVWANKLDDRQLKESYAKSADVTAQIDAAVASISTNSTIEVLAGDTLTAGDVCSLISEGGVIKAYHNPLTVNAAPNGAESVFNSAATTYISSVCLDSTRFLVTYADSDTYPKAIVGTVTGSTISWGSESAAFEAIAASYMSACKIDTDKVLVSYSKSSPSKGRCVVLSISETTITVNSPVDFYNGAVSFVSSAFLETDKAIITYREANTGTGEVVIASISTTTPSIGDITYFNNASTAYNSISAISSTSAIVAYKDIGNGGKGTAQILSISGTTITPGTEYVFENSAIIYTSCVVVDLTKAVITYALDAGGGKTLVATNSSGELSYGTAATFTDGDYNSTAKIDSTHVIIASQVAATDYGQSIIGTINGTGITLGTPYSYNAATTVFISVCHLGNQKSVIAYNDAGNSNYGTCCINTWATASYDSVAGISQGAYSPGDTATVLIKGTDTNQSALLYPTTYYLQSDMSIGTTPVSLGGSFIRLGISKSATELIMD